MNEFKLNYLKMLKKELNDIQHKIFLIEKDLHQPSRLQIITKKLKQKKPYDLTEEDFELVFKECTKCEVMKNLNEYHFNYNGKYMRHARCKTCTCK